MHRSDEKVNWIPGFSVPRQDAPNVLDQVFQMSSQGRTRLLAGGAYPHAAIYTKRGGFLGSRLGTSGALCGTCVDESLFSFWLRRGLRRKSRSKCAVSSECLPQASKSFDCLWRSLRWTYAFLCASHQSCTAGLATLLQTPSGAAHLMGPRQIGIIPLTSRMFVPLICSLGTASKATLDFHIRSCLGPGPVLAFR